MCFVQAQKHLIGLNQGASVTGELAADDSSNRHQRGGGGTAQGCLFTLSANAACFSLCRFTFGKREVTITAFSFSIFFRSNSHRYISLGAKSLRLKPVAGDHPG